MAYMPIICYKTVGKSLGKMRVVQNDGLFNGRAHLDNSFPLSLINNRALVPITLVSEP
ncbi:hypothetical protein ES703_81416 [subsurface metagenome]